MLELICNTLAMKVKNICILLIFSFMYFNGYPQERAVNIFDDAVVKIFPLKINTLRSDFGPAIVGDSLYFTSYSDKILGETDLKLRKNAFYDLYKAKIDVEGNTVSEREPIPEFFTKYHDGPVSWCKKTGELFVTQSDNISAADFSKTALTDTIRLRIVIAKKQNGKWISLTDFPYNNPAFSVGHPAISESGDTLIFSSDIHGGFGETDLYCSIRKDGKWGLPVNMGPQINTAGKEEFAFLTHNHTNGSYLIFASSGRFGFGGLDLFYTKFPFKGEEINHFDAPINSASDDFAMVLPPDAEFGFLTSNRTAVGNDDIFRFTFKYPAKPKIPEIKSTAKLLFVFNRSTLEPIADAKITACDKKTYLSDKGGRVVLFPVYKLDCEVVVKKFGYQEIKKTLLALASKEGETAADTLWLVPDMKQRIVLKNLNYDYDRWDILPESAKELDQLIAYLNENPELKADLSSHTDSRGDDDYNMKLSEKRAASAVNYIVSHGISADRIKGKGFGETQLLNKCANGVDCTPQEHRQNRRTEIFISEYGKAENVIQTKGDYSGTK